MYVLGVVNSITPGAPCSGITSPVIEVLGGIPPRAASTSIAMITRSPWLRVGVLAFTLPSASWSTIKPNVDPVRRDQLKFTWVEAAFSLVPFTPRTISLNMLPCGSATYVWVLDVAL
ncbi:116aa long hypothetical protein [Pyrococcus horikoshii OT3]|uniref:Uncharacterized protein n=1 Tax=Pyrococcus horikoshii (strain ATCC 700860 / DSM 12428 / JCM 9974 / NBRC 100139 / OT-3) TaxID=70601 RepID=O58282_PYRHO|nr:116aa long hypothetical protein [Pyrococcus horikoshii OT3]